MSYSIIESRQTTILISQLVGDLQDSEKTTLNPNQSRNQNQNLSLAHTVAHLDSAPTRAPLTT